MHQQRISSPPQKQPQHGAKPRKEMGLSLLTAPFKKRQSAAAVVDTKPNGKGVQNQVASSIVSPRSRNNNNNKKSLLLGGKGPRSPNQSTIPRRVPPVVLRPTPPVPPQHPGFRPKTSNSATSLVSSSSSSPTKSAIPQTIFASSLQLEWLSSLGVESTASPRPLPPSRAATTTHTKSSNNNNNHISKPLSVYKFQSLHDDDEEESLQSSAFIDSWKNTANQSSHPEDKQALLQEFNTSWMTRAETTEQQQHEQIQNYYPHNNSISIGSPVAARKSPPRLDHDQSLPHVRTVHVQPLSPHPLPNQHSSSPHLRSPPLQQQQQQQPANRQQHQPIRAPREMHHNSHTGVSSQAHPDHIQPHRSEPPKLVRPMQGNGIRRAMSNFRPPNHFLNQPVERSWQGTSTSAAAVTIPRPVDSAPGSRVRVVLGHTGRSFLLLLHQDNGKHQWQNRFWRNIPMGLDQKMRGVDYVHQCSFTDTEWFLSARCKLTGLTRTWWHVASLVLHRDIEAAVALESVVQVVFGESVGQYLVLFGLKDYKLGTNLSESLREKIKCIYHADTAISRIRGLNSTGGYLIEESTAKSDLLSNTEAKSTSPVFHSHGVSPRLRQVLDEAGLDMSDLAMGSSDDSWLVVRGLSYQVGVGLHEELVDRLDAFYVQECKLATVLSALQKDDTEKFESSDVVNETKLLPEKEIEDVGQLVDHGDVESDMTQDEQAGKDDTDQLRDVRVIPVTNSPAHSCEEVKSESTSDVVHETNILLEKESFEESPETNMLPEQAVLEESQLVCNANVESVTAKVNQDERIANCAECSATTGSHENEDEDVIIGQERRQKYEMAVLAAAKRLRKEDRFSALCSKNICVGQRIMVNGLSTEQGDAVVQSIDTTECVVKVEFLLQAEENKTSERKVASIEDPRQLIKFARDDGIYESNEDFLLPIAQDKFEAAVLLHHNHCKIGTCTCKQEVIGHSQVQQHPHNWKVGDRVNVVSYTNGTVVESKPKYADKPYLVHVQYDDGTSYHVSKEQVRPEKWVVSNARRCHFETSTRPEFEAALRVRPIFECLNSTPGEQKPFDEFKCAEKIDLRKLQQLVSCLRSDSDERRNYMDNLGAHLENDPDNSLLDYCYRALVQCFDLEEMVYSLHDVLKHIPMDPDGCVVHEVQYMQKNATCHGRLFAVGRSVRVLGWKFPRTLTLQGIHPELRAPLTGAFAHDIDCENSDVRLLCSLAKQIGCDDIIPSLNDYRRFRPMILNAMKKEHPDVSELEVKRLVNFIICGGTYNGWLRSIEEIQLSPQLKQFAFRLYTEVRVLRDQLLLHPRFQWTVTERDSLEQHHGLIGEAANLVLFRRILTTSENEVLRIIHRTFHNRGWIVRAKMFDSILVERGSIPEKNSTSTCTPTTATGSPTLTEMIYLAERSCEAQGWDVKLAEKPLHGCQNLSVPPTIEDARAVMQEYNFGNEESMLEENVESTEPV